MPTMQLEEKRVEETAFLPFARPWIGEEEIEAVVACLRSGWLTTGPITRNFEAEFAAYVGCRHAVAVNSCTAALHLALEAIGVQPGDEVLVPTLTFAATAEVVRYLGANPVLLDCHPDTFNLDPAAMAFYLQTQCAQQDGETYNRLTGARVRAVMPVHYAGLACDMASIGSLAQENGLAVVEDAAHALPCRINGRSVGAFGAVGAFSFYANKTLTTGEGGMLTTNDDILADRARLMSLHGMSRDAWKRFTEAGAWYYEIVAPGFKYNMADIAAALGRVQLSRADALQEIRCRYAARYTEAFRELPEVTPPPDALPGDQHAWHLYVLRLNLERLTLSRAQFMDELKARGIGASVHYLPLHEHPYYRETYGYRPEDLPVAARLYERIVTLPLYPSMADTDVERVVQAVTDIVECHRR